MFDTEVIQGILKVMTRTSTGGVSRTLKEISASSTQEIRFTAIADEVTVGFSRVNTAEFYIDNVSVEHTLPAEAKATIKWRPMFNSGDVAGIVNIWTANDESGSACFFDADNNLLKLTDGTNTSEVSCVPVVDTEYEITCQWADPCGMLISLGGVPGTTVSFAGSIPNADDLSFFWGAEEPQYIKLISIEKESGL